MADSMRCTWQGCQNRAVQKMYRDDKTVWAQLCKSHVEDLKHFDAEQKAIQKLVAFTKRHKLQQAAKLIGSR